VPNNIKGSLEEINEVSRQLLSRILDLQESAFMISKPDTDLSSNDEFVADPSLIELMSKREALIHYLFEQSESADIAQEADLLNEMVSLDNELTTSSKSCKQNFAEQIIKLKKSKKITKSYQKY